MKDRGRATCAASRARGGCGLKLLVLLTVMGAGLALGWMALLPVLFVQAVRERTGFDAEVASLSANPFTGRVSLRGLVLTNPPTFPFRDGLHLRSLEADVEMTSLLGERLVIATLAVDVRQFTWVRRAVGPTNAEAFRANLAGPVPTPPPAKSPVLIKDLRLQLDTLILADYAEAKPRVQTHPLAFDQRFRGVSTPGQLLVPAVLRVLVERNVAGGLLPFLPPGFKAQVVEAARGAETGRRSETPTPAEPFRGFLDKLEETRKP